MAYTAVKLADVQAAINAVKTAQSKYAASLSSTQPKKTALETAQKNLDEAKNKLQSMRDDFDRQSYLQNNSSYNNAMDAVKTSEQKLNEAQDFYDSGRYYKDNSTYNNYVNAFNDADKKLNDLRNFKDSGRYLEENSTYKNAVNAIEPKINALRDAENKLDNWSGNRSGSAWNSAVSAKVNADKAVSAAYTARDKASEAASNAADTLIRNQETIRSTAENNINKTRDSLETAANKTRETADANLNFARSKVDTTIETSRQAAEKLVNAQDQIISGSGKTTGLQSIYDKSRDEYQNVVDQTQPNLNEYNDAKNNVVNYVNDIKNSLGDVTTRADADAVKTLLGQISTAVSGTGISEFKDQINPLISQIDPIKMSSVPQLNSAFKNLSPDVFSNVDRATGMPLLNQAGLDKVLNKYGDNNLSSGQYRENYNAFGWNSRSDGSSVSRGPAVLGLDIGTVSSPSGGMGQTAKGYVKSGTSNPATDDDFKKAAGQLGLDFNSYIKPNKFVPTESTAYGSTSTEKATAKNSKEYTDPVTGETYLARLDSKGNFTNSLDKAALYNEIADKTKDFYVVSNALEAPGANKPAEHAAVLFKADGSGNLVPVVDQDGKVAASYYKTSTVTHAGWQGQLAELAPLIQMAAFVFAPQLGAALNSAIGGAQVAAAVAPTAFTVGVPAMTLTQAIGATAVNAMSSAVMNAGMSVLTGGDPLKAALSGAAGAALSVNASDVANNVMGAGDAIKGAAIIKEIASAANLSTSQVNQIVAAGANSAITSAVSGDKNILENVAANVAGQLAGSQAKNLVYNALENSDPKLLVAAADAASNVANIATQTAIKGGDVSEAIKNAAPSIFAEAVGTAKDVPTKNKPPIEDRSTYPEPTLDPSDVAKPDSTLGNYDVTKPNLIAGLTPEQVGQNQDNEFNLLGKKSLSGNPIVYDKNNNLFELTEDDIIPYVGESGAYITTGKVDKNGNEIVEGPNGLYVKYKSKNLNELGYQNTFNVPYDPETEELPIGSIFSFGTPPPPNVANKISLVGSGSTSTIDEKKFGIVAQDYGTPEEKLKAITDVETWEKSIQNDPKASTQEKTKAAEITKAIKDANVTNVQQEVKLPDVTPPEVKPPEVKPVDTKPVTPTTAGGGSSTAAPAPTPSLQQKADELQKQADDAQAKVLNAANNYIQNPTVENKAVANAAVLNYELAAKVADAAKADLVSKAEIPLPPANNNIPSPTPNAPTSSQQTSQAGAQQPVLPGAQQPSQPGSQQPAQPGLQIPGTDTTGQVSTPGSGTSNLLGDSTGVTGGLGGTGTGGTGAGGTGTSGSGTYGTGTGTGTGTGAGTGAGSGTVSTGGLNQMYTTTTPLAKRPIGDLDPLSHTMMTPEEIAARSTTQMVRRGGLVSVR